MKTLNQALKPLICAIVLSSAVAFAQSAPPENPVPATPQTSSTTTTQTQDALPDAPSTIAHDVAPAVPTGPTVVFDTTMGRLTCKLFDKEAPVTVANFVGLATGTKPWTDPVSSKQVTGEPFYDGTTFHRVIPGFMIQGGDRLGTGEGDAGYYIPDEITPSLRFDVPGRLAMANSGPGTDGSQFFITEAANPALDGKYTIFGQCDPHTVLMVKGIAMVDRDGQDKPLTPVVMNKVTIVPVGQPLPPPPPEPSPKAGASPTGSDSTQLVERPH
ncbi:MAG: peptidylprolyl isomerase [Acidobacteriaceae bacterium]